MDRRRRPRTDEEKARIREGIRRGLELKKTEAAADATESPEATVSPKTPTEIRKEPTKAPYDPVVIQVIINSLSDRYRREELLREDSAAFDELKTTVQGLHVRRIPIAVDYLLRVVANNGNDVRATAVKILDDAIPWDKVPPQTFKAAYTNTVNLLASAEDPQVGNIRELLGVGSRHASQFPQKGEGQSSTKVGGETVHDIADAWKHVAEKVNNLEVWKEISLGVYDMQLRIMLRPQHPQNIERRREILKLWQVDFKVPSLRAVLAEKGINATVYQVEEDLRQFADHGIILPRLGEQITGVESEALNQRIQALGNSQVTIRQLYDTLRAQGYDITYKNLTHRVARLGIEHKYGKEDIIRRTQQRRDDLVVLSGSDTTVKDLVRKLRERGHEDVTKSKVEEDIKTLTQQGIHVEVKRRPPRYRK